MDARRGDVAVKATRYLDDGGFRSLLEAAASRRYWTAPRDLALIYLLGKTGLRISEALSLRRSSLWLDGDTPFLRVVTLKHFTKRTDEVLLEPSTVRRLRRYRDVTLPDLIEKAQLRGTYPATRLGGATEPDPPLFPALGAAALPRTRIVAISRFEAAELFRFYSRRAGLPPGVTPHALRHYRASRLLRVTGDLEFTRSQLRHADIRNTQAYQHTDQGRVAGYLKRLDGDA